MTTLTKQAGSSWFQQSVEHGGIALTRLTLPTAADSSSSSNIMLVEVCLPTALLVHGAASVLLVNGRAVESALRQPGQLCLAERLGGGSYTVATSDPASPS